MIQALLVAVGGAIGSVLRYYVGQWALRLDGPAFPWGTLTVNVVGCFVIGVFAEMIVRRFDASPEMRLLLITGFLGGSHDLLGIFAGCHFALRARRGGLRRSLYRRQRRSVDGRGDRRTGAHARNLVRLRFPFSAKML